MVLLGTMQSRNTQKGKKLKKKIILLLSASKKKRAREEWENIKTNNIIIIIIIILREEKKLEGKKKRKQNRRNETGTRKEWLKKETSTRVTSHSRMNGAKEEGRRLWVRVRAQSRFIHSWSLLAQAFFFKSFCFQKLKTQTKIKRKNYRITLTNAEIVRAFLGFHSK